MANTVDIHKIQDGARNAVFRIYLTSDGTSGDLTDVVLIDVSSLNPDEHGQPVDNVTIERVHASFNEFSGLLEWDADTDDPALMLIASSETDYDFIRSGGLVNPKSAGYTGDITISTQGFSAVGDEGTIHLECKKRYG